MGLHHIFQTKKAINEKPLKDAFFSLDPEGNFVYISGELKKLIQSDKKSLIGKNIWKEFPTLVYSDFYTQFQAAISRQKTVNFEYFLKSLLTWYSIQIAPTGVGTEVFLNDITPLKAAQTNEQFLDEANTILASSLNYYQTLSSLAHLCVPTLADWCMIDLLEQDGSARRVEVACADPSKATFAEEIKKFPPKPDHPDHPSSVALYTGKSVLISDFSIEEAIQGGYNQAHAQLIASIAPCSVVAVPLVARGKSIGAMTLNIIDSNRRFNAHHLQFAEELARRAALHVDNARLFKESEEAFNKLKESETRLYNLIMQTPAMICLLRGQDHHFEFINPLFQQFFGGNDFTGKSVRSLTTTTQAQEFLQLLDLVYSTDKAFVGEEYPGQFDRSQTGILEECYFNFTFQPTHDELGKVDGILVFGIDVTDQVKAKKLLEEGADKLKIVLEATPQMAWTALPDGSVDYYNQRWYDYTGTTPEKATGTGWKAVVHPDDLQKTSERWHHSVQTGDRFEIENRFKQASTGQYRWHITRALPVKNKDNSISLWVGSCTDIHEQKSAIENLNQIQRELVRKNKDLERINSDLDNFVYAASHDLKAPVSNIEGLTGLLLECIREENVQNRKIFTALGMIDFSIKKFKTTIQDLTDIAKINKNLLDDVTKVDITEVIEEVMIMMSDLIHKSEAHIITRTNACQHIRFSYSNLKSLVYNLLSNAIKYRHPERSPEIIIETQYYDNNCLLSVSDNGLGIDIKNQEKIFNMFKRLHNHIEGSGVGLFLVKRIVEQTGGHIEVLSELEKGSTFKVYLNQLAE